MESLPSHHELLLQLGALTINMRAVEFVLRYYLYLQENPGPLPAAAPTFPQGSRVPENAFTNFDQLRKLIQKFNDHITDTTLRIDAASLVRVRDAFAHGRMFFTSVPSEPCNIVKFSDGKGTGTVQTEFSEKLSVEWLREQNELCRTAHDKVQRAMMGDPRAPTPSTVWVPN